MRYMLIDNPQAITACGDDKALVQLAERPKVRQSGETIYHFPFWRKVMQRPVGVGNAADSRRLRFWLEERLRFEAVRHRLNRRNTNLRQTAIRMRARRRLLPSQFRWPLDRGLRIEHSRKFGKR